MLKIVPKQDHVYSLFSPTSFNKLKISKRKYHISETSYVDDDDNCYTYRVGT